MSEIRYEYKKSLLVGDEAQSINISLPLILNKNIDEKRVGIFAYLKMCSGMDNIARFIMPDLVEWCGYKSDSKRVGGTNDRFLNIMDDLSDAGYFTYLTSKSRSKYIKCAINENHYSKDCSNGYATIYLDELSKILSYKRETKNDIYIKNTTILLVFAYLRHKIARRPNELLPEERTADKIKERKERLPEAYNCNIIDIANDLGISAATTSVALNILETELGLIVTDVAYRVKDKNGVYRTPNTIFANAYKRENNYLLITGEDYSRSEIEQKANKLKKMYSRYNINKDKRKQKK